MPLQDSQLERLDLRFRAEESAHDLLLPGGWIVWSVAGLVAGVLASTFSYWLVQSSYATTLASTEQPADAYLALEALGQLESNANSNAVHGLKNSNFEVAQAAANVLKLTITNWLDDDSAKSKRKLISVVEALNALPDDTPAENQLLAREIVNNIQFEISDRDQSKYADILAAGARVLARTESLIPAQIPGLLSNSGTKLTIDQPTARIPSQSNALPLSAASPEQSFNPGGLSRIPNNQNSSKQEAWGNPNAPDQGPGAWQRPIPSSSNVASNAPVPGQRLETSAVMRPSTGYDGQNQYGAPYGDGARYPDSGPSQPASQYGLGAQYGAGYGTNLGGEPNQPMQPAPPQYTVHGDDPNTLPFNSQDVSNVGSSPNKQLSLESEFHPMPSAPEIARSIGNDQRIAVRSSSLRNSKQRPRTDRELVTLLGSSDSQLRMEAAAQLLERGLSDANLELAANLATGSEALRLSLVDRIAQSSDMDPKFWLLWMAEEAEPAVRLRSISLLSSMVDVDVDRALRMMLNRESDEAVRRTITQVLIASTTVQNRR